MKKIYAFFVSIVMLSGVANAQFTKGQKVIGGNVGFATSSSDVSTTNLYSSKNTSVSFNPAFSKFVKSNQLVGFGLNYGRSYQRETYNNSPNNPTTQKSSGNNFGVSVFTQKLYTITQKLWFTTQLKAGADYTFGKNNSSNQNYSITNRGFGISVGLTPGLTYQLTNRWLLDGYLSNFLLAGYSYNRSNDTFAKRTTKGFNVSSSLTNATNGNLSLGFRYLLKN